MTAQLRYMAEVNPATAGFSDLADETEVTFMPLEAVWADDRLDLSRTAKKADVSSGYARFQEGDVLCPKVTPTFQAGRTAHVPVVPLKWGAATTEVHVVRARPGKADPRFLKYRLLSKDFLDEGVANFQGVAGLQRVSADFVSALPMVPFTLEEQRRIADFLDDQVIRIDMVIRARQSQIALLQGYVQRACLDMVQGSQRPGPRRQSGIAWLGDIPGEWHVVSVGMAYEVLLGKMLDESTFRGEHSVPYLRNTNVQWDRIDLSNLKQMDIAPNERDRFTVRPGDLLICEGGQPGRCAVWDESPCDIGYQKALHRARPRSGNDVRWLQNVLRAAVTLDVFGGPTGQTTIGHLTGEQLREFKIPLPAVMEQMELIRGFESVRGLVVEMLNAVERSIAYLNEHKRSLITAAVTGVLDVVTARRGVPG
jgi:type I restriction enzyme S subunit